MRRKDHVAALPVSLVAALLMPMGASAAEGDLCTSADGDRQPCRVRAISDGMLFWGSGYANPGGTSNNRLYAFGLGD